MEDTYTSKPEEVVINFGSNEALPLDSEQEEIVRYEESQAVISGPGSGKTRILTEKARSLFKAGKSLLCITFTRSAAREMSMRVPMIHSTTIHSYCCGVVGWKEEWQYSGLLYRFLKTKTKEKYEWILVDECQDLNEMEMDVILSLSSKHIFAVGDPYQSIYGFQGAMGSKAINKFKSLGCREFLVHNNYRSCESIVKRLNRFYGRNLISKDVKTLDTNTILFRKNEDLFFVSKKLKESSFDHRVRLSADFGENREYVVGKTPYPKWVLSTIHCSKGREFDKVILYDWFPSFSIEEEKRVYYVAMSRASKAFTEVDNIEGLLEELKA